MEYRTYFGRSCSFLIHLDGNCAVPCARTVAVYQFLPVSAGRSIGHDDAACLRDIASELV
jgi:hypothetical protein